MGIDALICQGQAQNFLVFCTRLGYDISGVFPETPGIYANVLLNDPVPKPIGVLEQPRIIQIPGFSTPGQGGYLV
jgi:hypothetical protein